MVDADQLLRAQSLLSGGAPAASPAPATPPAEPSAPPAPPAV